MPRFTEYFIQRLRERVDIVAVVSAHVRLKRSGGDMVGLCPFHSEKTPSFTVSPRKRIFHCFGCGKGGDVFRFLMEITGKGFSEVVLGLASDVGMTPEYDLPPPAPSESGATADTPTVKPSGEAVSSASNDAASAPGSDSAEPGAPSMSPIERFYSLLRLTDEDRAELRCKRGLSDEMIDRCGFRSNDEWNRGPLMRLAEEFSVEELVRCGLWRRGDRRDRRGAAPRPAGQFFGWGRVGKKKAVVASGEEDYDDLSTDDYEWARKESGLVNPVLIPYRDDRGRLVGLRPHKGFPKGQLPRLYVASRVVGAVALVTEGEFKAAAVADVLRDVSVAALPGIQMCKNLNVWEDLTAWLRHCAPREVVVVFDNEEKGDPRLPGFKANLEDRFDAHVWSRVLAERLEREGYRVRISVLPDGWRDEKGKADWDGALARFRGRGLSVQAIEKEFRAVLANGLRRWEFRQLKFFDPPEEQIIADLAARYAYEPQLPNGGKREQRLAEELRRLATKLRQSGVLSGRALMLAEAYEATRGWYYELDLPVATRERLMGELLEAHEVERAMVEGASLGSVGNRLSKRLDGETYASLEWIRALIRFLEIALRGNPTLVAAFRMQPYYVLVRPNGKRDRLVRLINIQGEDSGLVALPSRPRTAPRDMREWLSDVGNYNWQSGERAMQKLQADTDFILARREVRQLVFYGCDRPGSPWFFDDCLMVDGREVVPDDLGVFWHDGVGYAFLRDRETGRPIGDENQLFRLKDTPRMHPGMGLRVRGAGFSLERGEDDPDALTSLAGELMMALKDSYASWNGLVLLGAACGFAAAPHLYGTRGEFPGIWIVGEKGSGKNVTAKAIMAMWGYGRLDSTESFKASSTVNMIHTLQQLACIPNWGDEYKEGQLKEETVRNIVHCGYGREVPGKHSPDGQTRTIRTNFLVTGESMCANAATMDRYITVVAARENWAGTDEEKQRRFRWLLDNRRYFFALMRAVLRRHKEFMEECLSRIAEFEALPELANAEQRGRYAHAVAYGGLCGLVKVIPFMPMSELAALREWMSARALAASREVRQMVNVNQFLSDLVSAVKANAFGETREELRRYFKVSAAPTVAQLTEKQVRFGVENSHLRWKSYYLYFVPGPVIDVMRWHLRTRGRTMALDQADLRAQMSARAFWRPPPPHGSCHKQRFSGSAPESCWCLDVDKIPDIGYVPVPDEVFEQSLFRDGDVQRGEYIPVEEWVDPRKGDLFYLINMLIDEPK